LQLSGAALVAVATAVLIGRATGQVWLVRVVPDGAPMAFPTAIGFLLAGFSFLGFGYRRPRSGQLAALLLVLFGIGTLILYTLAEPLQLTRFIYDPQRPIISRGVGFDGRMSPNAASSFALLGIGLLMLGARHLRARLTAACIALLLAIALIAVVSYVTGLRFSTAWWRYTAMAIHTALAFLIAAVALLRWLVFRMASAEQLLTRTLPFFVVAVTSVIVLGSIVLVSNAQRLEATQWLNRTLEVEAAIDRFIASMARLESSTRAYGLTGDDAYVGRIEVHRGAVSEAAEALVRLTADNPPQQARARSLQPLIAAKFRVNEDQVRARRTGGAAAAAAALRAEVPELMDGLRAVTSGLQAEEQRVALRRRADITINETRLQWVLLLGGLVTVGLVGAAFALVHRAQRDLAEANDLLEGRVRGRTAELEASAEQLRESERRWRFLADTMPQLVWTARPDGKIETLNQVWLDYIGAYTEAAALATLREIVHPEDRSPTKQAWIELRRGRRVTGGEVRLRRADGEYRWHLWRAHAERDATGKEIRWVGTCTDIHDQKLAEERLELRVLERTAELRASEERFRQAFESAGIGMAIVALDGRWVRVNASICETVGYSQPELLEKTFQDITHPEDLQADLAHVNELVAGVRRSYQMEKRYLHRAGHVVWVRLTVSMVRDSQDRPVHFVSQIEDITEHKRLQRRLAEARDQAVEASRLKSEFLATMSHEIRTPMNGVIGMTALLRDTPLTAAQAEYVRTIESSGESLLTIINDILDYSKIEAGRLELDVAPFPVRQCVEDVIDLFAGRALEKEIELVHLLAADVPAHLSGDATRLRQVLVNLLGNALKFTERGEVIVTVEAEPVDTRVRLRFTVRDTGIGIPPAVMDRLFKSFSQGDASTTRRFGGTGLGLAISKRLVEMMGGEMRVESEVGKGSTFQFTIVANVARVPGDKPAAPATDLRERQLLVVDDHPLIRRAVAELAVSWGMRVHEAASGIEAMAWFESGRTCDVAVIDRHMPQMGGEEVARAIHARTETAALPLVLLSSLRQSRAGIDFARVLAKPIKADALRSALRASLRQPAGGSGASQSPFPRTGIDGTLGQRCPLQLLIAEDNPVNQRVASLLLQRLGYSATTVVNGVEAVAAVEMVGFEAILMDVDMPELDGCEATRRIRAKLGVPTRPWIIALTAGAMQSDRERAMSAGMNDFLTKPVRIESLAAALERAHAGLHGEA
jgi:PAS domain S-box-containing protein